MKSERQDDGTWITQGRFMGVLLFSEGRSRNESQDGYINLMARRQKINAQKENRNVAS